MLLERSGARENLRSFEVASSVCGALSCQAHAKISVGRRVGAALGAVCDALWCRAGANGAKHAKKRAVSERVLALSASRFGGERVRK